MADLRTRVSASLTPEAQTRMDNADQAFQSSISSELSRGWTSAGLSEKGNALLDQANNAYRSGDEATGRAIEAEGVRTLEQARIWAPSVQRASDIQDLGGAVKWGMGALASGVRSTLPSSAGALVGGAIGGLATRSIRGAQIGAGIGAGSAGYNQMANETIGEAMMDPSIRATKDYQEIKDTGRVSGALQAPLEAIVPGVMGGAVLGLTKGLGKAGIGRAVAAGMGTGAVTEAGTEFAQDLVGQGAMNSLRDKPLTQDLDYRQALDSAAAGAVAGGGMGAAGGAMTGLHARGAGLVDQGKDVAANPGQLLDKGAVLAGDALGKAHNAIDKAKSKLSGSLDEFIASRVIDPDRHALLAPMTEEEANLSGQELVDRFTPKAQAWASKVLQNPSAYDKEDVADATEFGTTNDPFLLQSKLKSRMGTRAGSKADEAIANELNPKTKSSRMSAATAEETKKEWDESTRLLAKIWRKQGIDEGIIQAVEGSEDDPIKQNAAIAVMSWVQRGFKDADGEVIVPEQMIRAYGAKRAGKLIKNAYDLAVGQGVVDPNESEVAFKDVQDRVKEMGKGHEADTAMVIDNLTPIARDKIVDALSFRDKASAQEHVFDLAKDIRSIVQAKAVEEHTGFLRELFGPKMNDVLDHFQPADAEVSSTRDVIADEKASFEADAAQETGEDLEYDPAINEVEADIDSKTRYVSQSKTNEYFDMHDELHRGRFDEETAKQTDPDTRVSKIGLIDREIEKVEAEQGRTLPPAERFEITKKIVKERLGLTAPSKLPDGAGPEQTKAHRKTVEDYERRVRAAASKLNMRYKAMRVSTEKMAEPRVNFSEGDVDELHLKNLDHRGERATIQRGVLFFDRGGNKTPYVTSTASILRRMFSIKDGTQQGTTDDFGGDAANRLELLKQGIASLMTSGGFGRVGYIKYAGQKPTWIKVKGGRLPSDLTIAVNKADGRPITVREAEAQMAEHLAKKPGSSKGTGLEGSVVTPRGASPETKKALDKLEVAPEGAKWRVDNRTLRETAFTLGKMSQDPKLNLTKEDRRDLMSVTKRFWDAEKGNTDGIDTKESIAADMKAISDRLLPPRKEMVEPFANEPDNIVPSERKLENYESDTSRREDDPATLGPRGKAINRDERGFINSGNTTMVAANMAGNESTVKVKPTQKQPVRDPEKKTVAQQDFSVQNVIDNLIRSVASVVVFARKSAESGRGVGALLDVLRNIEKMTPGQIRAFDGSLTAQGASKIKVRATNALARIERIGDERHRSGPGGDAATGAQGEVVSVHDEDLRSTDVVARTDVGAAAVSRSRAVAAEVRRDEGVAGGAAAKKLSQESALALLNGMVSSRNADTNLIRRILKNGDIDKSMRDELTADLEYLESIKAGSVGDSVSQKTVDGWSKMFAGGEKIIVSRVKGQLSGTTTALSAFQTVIDGERYLVTTGGSSKEMSLSILAHEFGHALQFIIFDQASAGVKHRVTAAWKRDVEAANADPKNTSRFMSAARLSGAIDKSSVGSIPPGQFPLRQLMGAVGESAYNSEHKDYVLSFEEWFAEQFSRYVTSDIDSSLPANVKGFWHGLIETFKMFFDAVIKPLRPNAEFKEWVSSLRKSEPADKTSGLKSWLSKAKTADIEKVKASIAKMNAEQLAILEKAVRNYTLLDEIGFDTDSKGAARLSAIEGAVFEAQDANTKSSKAKAEGKTLTEASPEVQAAKDHILKTVGQKVGLKFVKAFRDGKSGEHQLNLSGQENVIRLALNGDVLGTAYHESIHEFFDILSAGAATATRDVLLRAGKNKRLLREVSRKLDGHPEAQAQLSDPEEAVAYIYQFWKAGALKIGPETKTLFEKVSEYFRNVLGLVSDEMRERQDLLNAEKILTAFDQGTYGEETIRAGVMAAINADVERQDAAIKAVGEKWTTMVNTAGKLVLPAEQVIEASDNKHLLKVLRAFHQKTGDGMGEKASFFEAVSASKNRFMTRLEGVLAKRDKKDLELARKHLINGTTPTDPVTLSIVLKTREVLEDLYKFAAEKQVARWDEKTHEWVGLQHRKDYFPQVWDIDALLKNGAAFKAKLIETHQKELQAILDKTGEAGVTIDDVAQAILSRMLNSHGQVELDETTSDLGISPMAAAVNRRALDWLDNEVFDQFKEKDVVKILSSYVSSMVKRAEYTDRFGRGGEVLRTAADEAVLEEIGGSQLVNEATAKLTAAIAEWRDNLENGINAPKPTLRGVGEVIFATKKGKDVLTEAREKALKKLGPSLKAVMALEGTLGHDIKQGMRTFNSWMMTYQNFRLLSTSLFASFSDTVGLVLNGGELGDAWDGFVRGIREIKLRWQDDKSQDMAAVRAEQWGTVDAGSTLDALGQTYGSAWMSGTARRWSDSLFKWNGMEAWNRAMRITATNVAERVIREFKEKGFDKNDKAAVARFEELFGRGFKPENIKLDANGELDISDSKNQAAVNRWVNGAILRPNAAQRTVWGSDPHFQMIWHMKQFTYTFQNVILGKVIEQAKLGNYRPAMVMMAGYTPIIIAADAVKEMLIPGDEPPWMKGGLAGLIQHGVDKAGLLGIGQMGYDAMASDYGAGLTGPAISQLLHVPFDDLAKTTLGALPLGNLARRAAYD